MAKNTAEKKNNIVMIRLSDIDLARVEVMAGEKSIPVATLIRSIVHERIEAEVERRVAKIGKTITR